MNIAKEQYCDELRGTREHLQRCSISDPALTACIAGLARIEDLLRRPIRIVILGEYNSGKTSVADLLIGEGLLPTGVLANTRVPVLVSHADDAALYGVDRNATRIRIDDAHDPLTDLTYRAIQLTLPIDWLKDYQVLDTPALSPPEAFVADADIVIWCSVATRAWTESERMQWTSLPQRCFRNAILVCTHKDSVHTEDDCDQIVARLRFLTKGLFREIAIVEASNMQDGPGQMANSARADETAKLRAAVASVANSIFEKRLKKAGIIVRRLARLTFHHFGKTAVRSETLYLLETWDRGSKALLADLNHGRRSPQETVETLLQGYAAFAEKFRPGVVTGGAIPHSNSHALVAPMKWPAQPAGVMHFVNVLVSDLTALLRILAGSSIYVDPKVRAEYRAIQTSLLALADLDGSFAALSRMLGASQGGLDERRD